MSTRPLGRLIKEVVEDAIPDKATNKAVEVSKDAGYEVEVEAQFDGEWTIDQEGKFAVGVEVGAPAIAGIVDADAGVDAGQSKKASSGGGFSATLKVKTWFNSDGKKGIFGNR